MTCPLHTAPQSFCEACKAANREVHLRAALANVPEMTPAEYMRQRDSFASGNVKIGEPEVTFADGTGRHDAQAARIAGLEANVNEKLATIAALESRAVDDRLEIRASRVALRDAAADAAEVAAFVTNITDALGITGPHQGIDDAEILPAVREYVAEQRAMIVALQTQLACDRAARNALESQLASESRLVLSARISALATALRKSLADVDPKAMSTHEQQQARREARALLEEVGA